MKSKRKLIIFLSLLSIVILWSVIGILNAQKSSEPYKVSVVVDNSYHDRWMVLQEGLEQAAADNNIVMKYVFTNKFASVEQQMEVVEREIINGADGVIIQWMSGDVDYGKLSEIAKNKAVVFLASDINTEGILPICGVDNKEYGREAAGQIIDYCAEHEDKKVGIVMGSDQLKSTQEQLEAIVGCMDEKGIKPEWILYNTGDNLDYRLWKNISNNPVDVILAVGSAETEICAGYLDKAGKKDIDLFGTGYSKKNVYYLDRQTIKSLIIPDEFNMGYQAMEMIVQGLEADYFNSEHRYVDFHVVNCDEIYTKENERIVFPIVQ